MVWYGGMASFWDDVAKKENRNGTNEKNRKNLTPLLSPWQHLFRLEAEGTAIPLLPYH
jgi:hypothetical protein